MQQVTRRDFVKTAAAATVLLGTSKTGWAGANDRVRVAQMGLNGRGKSHLKGYGSLENVEVATLCDPDSALFEPTTKAFFADQTSRAEVRAGHPPGARGQGHRRRLDGHAQPLAFARHDLGLPGRERTSTSRSR